MESLPIYPLLFEPQAKRSPSVVMAIENTAPHLIYFTSLSIVDTR